MKKLLSLLLLPIFLYAQTPPSSSTQSSSAQEDFGRTHNNIIGAQSRSFGGGSIIKPNPMLTSAAFAMIQNPTYEGGWRYGTGLGFSKINFGKGFGVNAVLTFDLSQQSYSIYYKNRNWYYHLNFGSMGIALNRGASVTKTWDLKKFTFGAQLGTSIISNGPSDTSNKSAYYAAIPYVVLMADREFKISNRLEWKPEAFITLCSPYYDLGKDFFSTSSTFNVVAGNNVAFKIGKHFKINLNWRANINTTPQFTIMNNILFGSNLKF